MDHFAIFGGRKSGLLECFDMLIVCVRKLLQRHVYFMIHRHTEWVWVLGTIGFWWWLGFGSRADELWHGRYSLVLDTGCPTEPGGRLQVAGKVWVFHGCRKKEPVYPKSRAFVRWKVQLAPSPEVSFSRASALVRSKFLAPVRVAFRGTAECA